MARGIPPYRVGWHPAWLTEPMDVSLTWPSWEYGKKADAVSDAKAAAKSALVPVVVYNGRLEIVCEFQPKVTCDKPTKNDALVERLRKELMDAKG